MASHNVSSAQDGLMNTSALHSHAHGGHISTGIKQRPAVSVLVTFTEMGTSNHCYEVPRTGASALQSVTVNLYWLALRHRKALQMFAITLCFKSV